MQEVCVDVTNGSRDHALSDCILAAGHNQQGQPGASLRWLNHKMAQP